LDEPIPEGAIAEFCEVLRGVHGEPHVAKDEDEAVRVLHDILRETGATKVAVAGVPPNLEKIVLSALQGTTHHLVGDLSRDNLLSVLSECNCGITWAEFAVAREGALIEIVYDDAAKITSSLPFTHIALVSSGHFLPNLAITMREVGKIVSSCPPGRKPTVSLIAGPSKTGDIEMRLLYGVHGPNNFHVVILDWTE
jgi:L-lactate dehydrogenase complex protein LldG